MKIIFEILSAISIKNKRNIIFLYLLMVLTAIFEILTIATIVPFLTIITTGEDKSITPYIDNLIKFFEIESVEKIKISGILFIISVIIGAILKIIFVYYQQFVSRKIGIEINVKIFNNLMNEDYSFYSKNNSADLISGIQKSNAVVTSIIYPFLSITTSSLIIAFVLFAALMLSPLAVLYSSIFLVGVYCLIYIVIKKKIHENGHIISVEHNKSTNILVTSVGGIRELIINNLTPSVKKSYETSVSLMHNSAGKNDVYKIVPRHVIEASSMVIMGIATLWLVEIKGPQNIIPLLGAIILAGQRMIPMFQQIYAGIVAIKGWMHHAKDVSKLLKTSKNSKLEKKIFNNNLGQNFEKLELVNISFKYSGDKNILNNVNFEIRNGDKVGIIGHTGSGKSTLMDILLGLISPTAGELIVNGKNLTEHNIYEWRNLIAHVSQNPYLHDGTIKQNICLQYDKSEIDESLMIQSAKKAKIYEYIMTLKEKFDAEIGERGGRLSGGQRQRIAIARALYKKTGVLILDEPTSALDKNTEMEVMEELMNKDSALTIILITHNSKNLIYCNKILKVENNEVKILK